MLSAALKYYYSPKGQAYRAARLRKLKRLGLCVNCCRRKGKLYCKPCAERINKKRRQRYHTNRNGMKARNRFLVRMRQST